jgi:hypothetical protein
VVILTATDVRALPDSTVIPTVNNPTITITQGGVTKGSFSLNQATGDTIALDAGGGGGGAVDSVNGKTGVVILTATDVRALPDSTVIPTVNNPTITITQGGVTKGSFSLNQSAGDTIELDAGGGGGHEVIAFQAPTSGNNYTWYRKYADGWVEQGGACAPVYAGTAVSFPITMANTDYQFQLSVGQGQLTGTVGAVVDNRTTTGMTVYSNWSATQPDYICWEVKGMSA